MTTKDEFISQRVFKSFLWTVSIQEVYLCSLFLLVKFVPWNFFNVFSDWICFMLHWKTLLYQIVLGLTTITFGALNLRFYSVEKTVPSTRYEKLCRAFSSHCIQHFILTAILGGIISYCWVGLLRNFDLDKTWFSMCFSAKDGFETVFIVNHGCYTGIMFSLKYFICSLYLLKFKLEQRDIVQNLQRHMLDALSDSVFCVVKSMHWYYLLVIISCPLWSNTLELTGIKLSQENVLYSLINLKLLFMTFVTGVVVFFNWNLYLLLFNLCATEIFVFPIEASLKADKDSRTLSAVLTSTDASFIQHLAILDLRLLSKNDTKRRKQIFAISYPGGHPYQWKAISNFSVKSLQEFTIKLQEHSLSVSRVLQTEKNKINQHQMLQSNLPNSTSELSCLSQKVLSSIIQWPVIAYFVKELPSTKIRQIFSKSQSIIWITEALGYLVTASYAEDSYGVVQQTLPSIICALLDLKMAEEKLPIDLVGTGTHVKDPQGRYDHIHQRIALKNAVAVSLYLIADTFKDDINGIYLSDEYQRQFKRILNQRNL